MVRCSKAKHAGLSDVHVVSTIYFELRISDFGFELTWFGVGEICLLVSWCAGDGCNLVVDDGMIEAKRGAWCRTIEGDQAESR